MFMYAWWVSPPNEVLFSQWLNLDHVMYDFGYECIGEIVYRLKESTKTTIKDYQKNISLSLFNNLV